jgi:hypothetical protein
MPIITLALNSNGDALHNAPFDVDLTSVPARPFEWTLTAHALSGSDGATPVSLQFSWLYEPRCITGNLPDVFPYGLMIPPVSTGVTTCGFGLGTAIPPRMGRVTVVSGSFTQLLLYLTIQ